MTAVGADTFAEATTTTLRGRDAETPLAAERIATVSSSHSALHATTPPRNDMKAKEIDAVIVGRNSEGKIAILCTDNPQAILDTLPDMLKAKLDISIVMRADAIDEMLDERKPATATP